MGVQPVAAAQLFRPGNAHNPPSTAVSLKALANCAHHDRIGCIPAYAGTFAAWANLIVGMPGFVFHCSVPPTHAPSADWAHSGSGAGQTTAAGAVSAPVLWWTVREQGWRKAVSIEPVHP